MSTPKIAFHGGKCCGVRHIHYLGDDPDGLAGKLDKQTFNQSHEASPDQYGRDVSSKTNMYPKARDAESYGDRVKEYVAYLDIARPYGVIEIILADSDCPGGEDCNLIKHHGYVHWTCHCHTDDQTKLWRPFIEALGFVEVTNCHNSNSGNRIFIFHRKREEVK